MNIYKTNRELRLEEKLRQVKDLLSTADVSSGCCCCGEAMNDHANPMDAGHMPVDLWDYIAYQQIEEINKVLGEDHE